MYQSMIMVKNEPQTEENPGDPDQTLTPLKNGSEGNFRFLRREPDRRTRGSDSTPVKATDLKEKEGSSDDEEETEPERSSSQQRHRRGGRPEKRIIEESAYDPYCE
jgi:hypothetical protein